MLHLLQGEDADILMQFREAIGQRLLGHRHHLDQIGFEIGGANRCRVVKGRELLIFGPVRIEIGKIRLQYAHLHIALHRPRDTNAVHRRFYRMRNSPDRNDA
jgi:hypothetical protein